MKGWGVCVRVSGIAAASGSVWSGGVGYCGGAGAIYRRCGVAL